MAIKLEDFIPKNTNIFGARTPSYLEGLITPEQMKQAQQQSLFQGLLGTAVGYLAQPKNQMYGSAVPYLAKGYLQGMQMAQTPYSNLERDLLMKEKFDQMKIEKQRQEDLRKLQGNLYTTTPAQTITTSDYQPIVQTGPDGTMQVAPSFAPYSVEETTIVPEQRQLNTAALQDYIAKYPTEGLKYAQALEGINKLGMPTTSRVLSDQEVRSGVYGNLDPQGVYQISPTGAISTVQAPTKTSYGIEADKEATRYGFPTFNQADQATKIKILDKLDLSDKEKSALMGGFELGTKSKNEVQSALLQATDRKRRLNRIIDSFDPEFLTAQGKIKSRTLSFLEKWGMKDLSPEEVEYQEQYTDFMKDSYAEMNQYIKDITGAALSEFEAERIRKAIPDPEKDSPTVFKRGMDRAFEELQIAEARLAYLNNKGLASIRDLSLDDFSGMIQETGEQVSNQLLKSQLYNPNNYKTLSEMESKDPANFNKIMEQVNKSIAAKYGLPRY